MQTLTEELKKIKEQSLYRSLKQIDEKKHIVFCSNDYLGLSQHPKIKETAAQITQEFGTGAGASRLISGNHLLYSQLEAKIASFKQREAALVFPTGYMANLGALNSLLDGRDTVIMDRLNHASLVDAARLSKAKLQVYPHKDMTALEKVLKRSQKFVKRLVVTDSVFSMDGDIAPLPRIVKLAKKYNALTMIDEAHATGVLGKTGRGAEEHFEIVGQIDIVMGTLSKAIGSLGGFVAGSTELIDYLINKARSFIYTTGLPPAVCAASLTAFEIIENQPALRRKLWQNVSYLKGKLTQMGFNLMGSETQIIPIFVGDSETTIRMAEFLFEHGIFVSGIRPPTVPKGQSRLRISVSAQHTKENLDELIEVLNKWQKHSS
jgi:glycine C-acetyltransferase/8-amino-7-oxononanoate synthase